MVRLSIIVPVYGVEKYIEECIRSLYAQDILQEEYEVICVDDCSPDCSRAIIERLQKEYSTLRLICHTENKKQGGARNTGLMEARGEYVWFVDSDDTLMPNVFKLLLDTAERNEVDILQFDYTRGSKQMLLLGIKDEIKKGEEYLFGDRANLWYDKVIGPWRQIIRRQFLIKNQLMFVEGMQYEDTDYILKAFITAQRVQHVSLMAYRYHINEESVTISAVSPMKFAWQVNQVVRCFKCIDIAKTQVAKDILSQMVANNFLKMRVLVKSMTVKMKWQYRQYLTQDLKVCKPYVNWRTWFAIRYAIAWFI